MSLIHSAWPFIESFQGWIIGGLCVAGIWLLTRSAIRLPARLQCAVWWLAGFVLLWSILPLPDLATVEVAGLPAVTSEMETGKATLATAPATGREILQRPGIDAASKRPLRGARFDRNLARDSRRAPEPAVQPGGSSTWLPGLKAGVLLPIIWAAGTAIALFLLVLEHLASRRTVRRARKISALEADLLELEILCRRAGLTRKPDVVISSDIVAPQVSGIVRPTLLLPDGFTGWEVSERRMAVLHELSHLARHDLLWGWVPALVVRILWFHPFAWVAAREYALAREAACDARVLDLLDVHPRNYARLLVSFCNGGRDRLHGKAALALSAGSLKRRLIMLQDSPRGRGRLLAWLIVPACLLVGLAPIRVIGKAVDRSAAPMPVVLPGEAETMKSVMGAVHAIAPAVEAAHMADCIVVAPALDAASIAAGIVVAPAIDVAEVARSVEAAIAALDAADLTIHVDGADVTQALVAAQENLATAHVSVTNGIRLREHEVAATAELMQEIRQSEADLSSRQPDEDQSVDMDAAGEATSDESLLAFEDAARDERSARKRSSRSGRNLDSWVFLNDDEDRSVSMMGDMDDIDDARDAMEELDADEALWFRLDGDAWIITDPATMERAREIMRPMEELGERQGELGVRQGELGEKQGQLGEWQGDLGGRQGELGLRIAELNLEIQRRARRDLDTSDLEREIREVSEEMEELGEKQGRLGAEQARLGEMQAELGAIQAELGAKQQRAAEKARDELEELGREVIDSGTAKRAD